MKVRPLVESGGIAVELAPDETQIPAAAFPFKIKRILAPIDFSDCSRKAVRYAEAMAKELGAELVLLHVLDAYMPVTELALIEMAALLEESRAAQKKGLAEWKAAIDEQVASRTIARSGHPYHEIIAVAEELDADLIVISTHGRTGFARAIMGSTTERVVRLANCPVLVVREREHDFLTEDKP